MNLIVFISSDEQQLPFRFDLTYTMSDENDKKPTATLSKSRIPFAKTGRRLKKLFSLKGVSSRFKTRSSIKEVTDWNLVSEKTQLVGV